MIRIKGVDYTANDFDAFRLNPNSSYVAEQGEKLANDLIASNDSMKGAVGVDNMNIYKWANKGLKIGVVYKAKDVNDGNGNWSPGKFLEPHYSVAVSQVEDWTPDTKAHEDHQAKWFPKGGNNTTPAQASTPAPAAGLPVEDELPF